MKNVNIELYNLIQPISTPSSGQIYQNEQVILKTMTISQGLANDSFLEQSS